MVKEILDKINKQEIVGSILKKLPKWFGIPEAIENYIKASQDSQMFVKEINQEIVGFILIKKTSECAAEIHVIGVVEAYHHQGIGNELVKQAESYCIQQNLDILHVKTLAPGVGNEEYLKTYNFYKAVGFKDLEVLPLWDEQNPCLILIKFLRA